ncbi:DUF4373 domain-containing protein, partial [Enterococcus hirae]|nr:DUF4373 domain-containing protein [Enterococcus hirae]
KKGYFILWNDLTQATLLKRLPGVSKEMLNQIVNRLVKWGFFDKQLFDSVEVLTSENIQATYFEATKRRKSPKPTKYVINANINTQDERVNDDINPQSKGNKSKLNKIKDYEEDMGVYEFIQKSWGKPPTGILQGALGPWIREWGSEMILFAFQSAYENSVEMQGLKKYVDKILATWKSNNVSTLQEAVQAKEDWEAKKSQRTFSNSQPSRNVTRKEPIPKWLADYEEQERLRKEREAHRYDDVPF